MNTRQTLFIYDRREIVVFMLLCAMFSLFAFTLGVHFGKRVGNKGVNRASLNPSLVKTVGDQLPTGPELIDRAKAAQGTLDRLLNENLHQEVKDAGIKLEDARQIDLPSHPKSPNAGATHLKFHHKD